MLFNELGSHRWEFGDKATAFEWGNAREFKGYG
jgi:hypothetical protein